MSVPKAHAACAAARHSWRQVTGSTRLCRRGDCAEERLSRWVRAVGWKC
jgi:hypothetical protein